LLSFIQGLLKNGNGYYEAMIPNSPRSDASVVGFSTKKDFGANVCMLEIFEIY